jgi:hypothetical protein
MIVKEIFHEFHEIHKLPVDIVYFVCYYEDVTETQRCTQYTLIVCRRQEGPRRRHAMLNYNDVLMAQERHAEMRRTAAQENRKRALLGNAGINVAQRVAAVVANMKQRLVRTETQAKPVGNVMPGKAA